MFTLLPFNTVRYLNYSYLIYCFFDFDPKYIIQRYSFLLFLQNNIITIITSYGQFVKTHFFFCINSFYLMFIHISLHRFISAALLCIIKIMVFRFCLCPNSSIRIYILLLTFLSCLFSVIPREIVLLIVFSASSLS